MKRSFFTLTQLKSHADTSDVNTDIYRKYFGECDMTLSISKFKPSLRELLTASPAALLLILCMLLSSFSYAQSDDFDEFDEEEPKALRVKGKKVVISGGSELRVGDVLIAFDYDDRRRGAVRVIKIGRSKALAKILKGSVKKGWFFEKYERKKKRKKTLSSRRNRDRDRDDEFEEEEEDRYSNRDRDERELEDEGFSRNNSGILIGLLFGTNQNTMKVDIPVNNSTTTAEMTGSSSGFHLFGTYPWKPRMKLLASIGQQKFDAVGTVDDSSCTNSNDCTVSLTYLVGTVLLRYEWMFNKFTPWAAGGLGIMSPSSATSSAIEPSSISTTTTGTLSAGVDYRFNREWSITGSARYYHFFGSSSGVSTNIISFLGGLAYHYK